MLSYVFFVLILICYDSNALKLHAYISQHGLYGEIEFTTKNSTHIEIKTNLQPTLQFPDQVWRWSINEFLVDYRDTSNQRCYENLGNEVIDFTEELGYLIIPGKENAVFESANTLFGAKGLWGKSLVLRSAEPERVICASIVSDEEEKYATAKFNGQVAGDITFRWLTNDQDAFVQTDLFHTKAKTSTVHKWELYVTDVFKYDRGDHENNCETLQYVFDHEKVTGLKAGDFHGRFGLVTASGEGQKRSKKLYKDDSLFVLRKEMDKSQRGFYLVLYDSKYSDSFMSCAVLRMIDSKSAKALISMDGIKGEINIHQRSPFDPTWTNITTFASDKSYESNLRFANSITGFYVKELPAKVRGDVNSCNTTGGVFNPTNVELGGVPPAGLGTQDQYAVGDLLGKQKQRAPNLPHNYFLPGVSNELNGLYWDVFLPLYGVHSVVHRSIVIERQPPKRPICGTIILYDNSTGYQETMISAEVVYRYPIVGRVIFRQPLEKPWDDTTVIIESMIHADGSHVNTTFEHRWAVHTFPPGKDFYNWTGRCLSAGKMFSPNLNESQQYCSPGLEGYCALGDFTSRHGHLTVAGRKRDSDKLTRHLFTDTVVTLSGRLSIMGKSLVIYDDHGPVARGERMACSVINGLHRRKAVIQDWFGNGDSLKMKGKMELTQQSEYDVTNIQVQLEDLDQSIVDYRLHPVPVLRDLEFPCDKTSLYDTYNPYNVNETNIPGPGLGTSDQYELGDLGKKFGFPNGQKRYFAGLNETQITLFGLKSIIGRSMVFHQKLKDRPYACSSIERGYSPSEGREIRGIASFHHPDGFAYGYIRMTQLVHNDGSTSDTTLEVNLRYPGERDRNMTHNHNWDIYVNPTGVDAAVKITATRCVAAGYRWNPYYTQLADPLNQDLYRQECGADNPLRCEAGDLTARLGTISLGVERQMFTDSNFPLEGSISAMGRSIVIFGPNRSPEKLACANIAPDKDIIKFVNINKPPRFVLSTFLDQVRQVMGVPPWMVTVDSRKTNVLHGGGCIQFLLHFTGPAANQLELDFTRLLASGRLDSPSIYIPGYINQKRKKTISYRVCGGIDDNEPKKVGNKYLSFLRSSAHTPSAVILFIFVSQLIIVRL